MSDRALEAAIAEAATIFDAVLVLRADLVTEQLVTRGVDLDQATDLLQTHAARDRVWRAEVLTHIREFLTADSPEAVDEALRHLTGKVA